MATNNDFKVILEAMIDNSSLSDIQKQLAKERLKINADISVEDFAKSKKTIENLISDLAKDIKNILGNSVPDKQASQWAKEYYNSMISNARKAAKEEEYLVNAMAKGREQAEKARQEEEKRQQLVQNNAINKALEKEYQERQKILNATQKQAELEQQQLNTKVNSIQASMDGSGRTDYNNQVNREILNFQNVGIDPGAVPELDNLIKRHSDLQHIINSTVDEYGSLEAKQRAIIQADEERTKALNQARNAYQALKMDASQYYNLDKQSRLSTKIQNWLSKNTRASQEAKQSLQSYYSELSNGNVSVARLEYIENQLNQIDATERGLGRLGKNLKDQLSDAAESFGQWMSVSSAIMGVIYNVREAVVEIKELDNILTEISKTSDLTDTELKQLGENSFESASQFGRTASDYLTGVQEMYRSGFDDAEGMAELSILAQAAGDMTRDIANNYLTATSAAYEYEGSVEKLNKVLDGQNMIKLIVMPYRKLMAS